MPTTVLTLAWLLASTMPLAGTAPASSFPPCLTLEASTRLLDQPALIGRVLGTDQDQPGWLLIESDNDEETDDSDDRGTCSPLTSWPRPRSPFGLLVSNQHPTVIPQSSLRSPILRC